MFSRRAPSPTRIAVLATVCVGAGAAAAIPTAGLASSPGGAASTGAPHIHAMATVANARIPATSKADCVLPVVIGVTCVGVGTPMAFGGGAIQTSPAVYIVQWGWKGSDPSGVGPYQQSFFNGIGGTAWNGTQSQYCDSTTLLGLSPTCISGAGHVGNPSGVLKGVWVDDIDAVPSNPDDTALQAEAVRAASHFGNTTPASNASTQYIIDTPHGNSTTGFGTQWCSYHGAATSSAGALSYTDFPYMPDAGSTCGMNFINSGSAGVLDGVSIVGGHEFAESETDPNPPTGWTDTIGSETGDKCAWIFLGPGSVTNITLSTGTFAVQSLWSNSANSGAGGCALS